MEELRIKENALLLVAPTLYLSPFFVTRITTVQVSTVVSVQKVLICGNM